MRRVVLAYDGGGEMSIAIPWVMEERGAAEVVAMIVDVGRGAALVEVRERALALGAIRCHVIDAREEFARDYVLPALHAGAFDDGSPRIATLAHRLVAKKLVDVARMEHAEAIAVPGDRATDTETLEALVRDLDSSREIIVPAREWTMMGEALAAYARAHDVDVIAQAGQTTDANIWGRATTIPDDASPSSASPQPTPSYELTRSPEHAPDQPADLEIEFDAGVPMRVNGIDMSLLEMLESLETIGGSHGIGRTDVRTTGRDGRAYRVISESPAAAILSVARAALGAGVNSGTARVRLFKGTCAGPDDSISAHEASRRAATAKR
jgi:argininosuccinate synthase